MVMKIVIVLLLDGLFGACLAVGLSVVLMELCSTTVRCQYVRLATLQSVRWGLAVWRKS